MSSNRGGVKFVLIYSLFIVLFCIFALEGLVRLFNLHDPLVWRPHPELGWEHVPGAKRHWTEEGDGLIKINTLGFRDKERSLEKPEGSIRVAVFGDSQTEAVQINLNETFPYLLEEALSTKNHLIQVLNFGVNGYSPIQELLLIKKIIPVYKPDLVVVAVFLDNDVSGCSPALNVSTSGTPYIKEDALPTIEFDYSGPIESYNDYFKEPKRTIRSLFGLYRFLYRIKDQIAMQGASVGEAASFPERYNLYNRNQIENWTSAWVMFEVTLREFRYETGRYGIPLLLLSIPGGQTVDDKAWQRIIDMYPAMRNQDWELDRAEERLKKTADYLGIMLVQPYLEFRKRAAGGPQLFFGDLGHLTIHGHRLIASALEPKIRILFRMDN